MRIEKIIIDNFRCFEHKEISFHPQFNVIISKNGFGKTVVADAIAYLLKPFNTKLAPELVLEIEKKDIRRTRFGLPEETSDKPTELVLNFNLLNTKESWSLLQNINMIQQMAYQYENIQNQVKRILNSVVDSNKNYPIIAYYPANRVSPQTSEIEAEKLAPNGSRDIGYENALNNKNIDIKLITSRINTLEYSIYTKSKYSKDDPSLHITRSELNAIQTAIVNCIPNATEIGFNPEWNELMIHFEDEDPKPFSMLSEGFRNMLAIVGDIAYRCARLNPHLNENILTETEGIVIIDEIDLHLHPNWQREIVGNLKKTFPKIQFIVTTHSPFIVQSLKKEELINLEEPEEELTIDPEYGGIEDAAEIMNVEGMPQSIHFKEMTETAEKYYKLISAGKTSKNDKETAKLRERLNELEERYSNDPVFVALLKSERKVNGL